MSNPLDRPFIHSIRLPLPAALTLVGGVPLVIWVALASGGMRYVGAVWDVSWHRTIGRDTFWSPPHLALYAGVSIGLIAALWAVAESVRANNRVVAGPWLRLGPFAWPASYFLAFVGSGIILLSAPFDDLWHFLYGRDVDIWSPPHLMAVFGGAVGVFGWLMAVAPLHARGRVNGYVAPQFVYFTFLGWLLYTGWFALNWYSMVSATRDTLLYPSLVGLLLLPTLVVATALHRWGATFAAASFFVVALLPIAFFGVIGWKAPAFPPLLVVPALAVDLIHRRWAGRCPVRRAVFASAAFAVLFLVVELARMQLVPATVPPGPGVYHQIIAPYLAAVEARPWTVSSVVAALPVVIAASVAGAALGGLLRVVLGKAREQG